MEAKVIFYDSASDIEEIEVNGHRIQFGGSDGDRYCFAHQSFHCFEGLTAAERLAIRNAPPKEWS